MHAQYPNGMHERLTGVPNHEVEDHFRRMLAAGAERIEVVRESYPDGLTPTERMERKKDAKRKKGTTSNRHPSGKR